MDSENSITVHVWVGGKQIVVDGFTSSDTISVVKERVLKKATELDMPPLLQDIREMQTLQRQVLEDNHTLASLSNSASDQSTTITMYYRLLDPMDRNPELKEDMLWFKICQRLWFNKEAHMPTIQASLPIAQFSDLCINGHYNFFDLNKKSLPLSEIKLCSSVQTNASVILLAPNDEILKDLVSLNSESKYLVLRVSWDILSYYFLRTLRSSYPDIPIVAVTDLDPHHLNLLTFLDTSPDIVIGTHGWDLSVDLETYFFDDEVYAADIDFVEIKWLGLRPTDCESLFFYGATRSPLPGFNEVIRMLKVNPHLRMKEHWLAALHWLEEFGSSVSFHPRGDCHVNLGDDFIAKKVYEKDWV